MNFRQKLPLFFGLFGFLCLLLPNTAIADSFDWSYQGTIVLNGPLSSGSGELTTTNGIITGLSGTFNGLAITALLPPGAFAGNDNVLQIPGAPLLLTLNGFSFLDSAGDQSNIFASEGTQCTCGPSGCVCVAFNIYASVSDNGINADFGNFTLTPIMATPEPATTTLLLVGFFGLLLGWSAWGHRLSIAESSSDPTRT